MSSKFTIRQRNEIVAQYTAGRSISKIAADFGCDRTYPVILARRRNKARPAADRERRHAETIDAYTRGEKIEVISTLTGYAPRRIHEIVRTADCPRRQSLDHRYA